MSTAAGRAQKARKVEAKRGLKRRGAGVAGGSAYRKFNAHLSFAEVKQSMSRETDNPGAEPYGHWASVGGGMYARVVTRSNVLGQMRMLKQKAYKAEKEAEKLNREYIRLRRAAERLGLDAAEANEIIFSGLESGDAAVELARLARVRGKYGKGSKVPF